MRTEPIPVSIQGPSEPSPTVVVVDDDLQTLAALRRAFRKEPVHLLTSSDPWQVLEWVEDRWVSVVFSDQRMPMIQGTELLREVRLRSPRTRGVILTAYPESLRLDPDLEAWLGRVVPKPWEDQELRALLRQFLRETEASLSDPLPDLDRPDPDLGGEA